MSIKILLLGNIGVGKTSLCNKMKTGDFIIDYNSTIGIDYKCYDYSPDNRITYNLQFWDTTGQDKFNSLISCYFRKSNVIIIMFDMNSKDGIIDIKKWLELVEQYLTKNMKIIFVGNKNDLPIHINMEELTQLINIYNCAFISISVKNDKNFNKMLDTIVANYIIPIEIETVNIKQTARMICCNIIEILMLRDRKSKIFYLHKMCIYYL